MRILVCETGRFHFYGQIWVDRFRELGAESELFREFDFFSSKDKLASIWLRFSNIYRWGAPLRRLNQALLRRAQEYRADAIFIIRGDLIFPETLEQLRKRGIVVLGWNNDNAFADRYPKYMWRHFRASLPFYSHCFAYRQQNITDFLNAGCPSSSLLRSFYIREQNFLVEMPFIFDVSFTGHWEADDRHVLLQALGETHGRRLGIYGADTWRSAPNYRKLCSLCGPIRPALGPEYNRVLNASKIALVFLSKLNADSYTRRCFEIPAAGSFMLSEFTEDQDSLFKEGVDAEYFRSSEELVDKVRFYLQNESARAAIARAGHERVLRDGHEALDRARTILDAVDKYR